MWPPLADALAHWWFIGEAGGGFRLCGQPVNDKPRVLASRTSATHTRVRRMNSWLCAWPSALSPTPLLGSRHLLAATGFSGSLATLPLRHPGEGGPLLSPPEKAPRHPTNRRGSRLARCLGSLSGASGITGGWERQGPLASRHRGWPDRGRTSEQPGGSPWEPARGLRNPTDLTAYSIPG